MPNIEVPSAETGHLDAADRFDPPGGILVWIIVFVELVTFGAGLVVFVVHGRGETEAFRAGRALLNQPLALANTLILLTGGWCMANGIATLRSGSGIHAASWVAAAIGTGAGFLLLKSVKYAAKIEHGIGFGDDTFFTLYFLLTGFHFLHVLVATALLIVMWRGIRGGKYSREVHHNVESSGIFWHMCDLIWLLLYPVIYLLR
jgi:nitric oxide reductase NorE protein